VYNACVRDLTALRESGELHETESIRQLRATTVQESLNQWLVLQQAFEWQLQKTKQLFENDRRQALVQLQARLHRLIE
jgi:hypothetical protein